MTTGFALFWTAGSWIPDTIPAGCAATTPIVSWLTSWTVNATFLLASVLSPTTSRTSIWPPNAGGWA